MPPSTPDSLPDSTSHAAALPKPALENEGPVAIRALGHAAGRRAAQNSCDAKVEEIYWRTHHRTPAALADERNFEDYAAAYRVGYTGYRAGQSFAQRAEDLALEYGLATDGESATELVLTEANAELTRKKRLAWEEVRGPIQAAYERIAQSESSFLAEELAQPGAGHLRA